MGVAFLYGNGGGAGSAGSALVVTAPAGSTVTVSKGDKTKTAVVGTNGLAAFNGLSTGIWNVMCSDGEQFSSQQVTITSDYSITMAFFAATINVTYPSGSVCTVTDGYTTIVAPDTSGTYSFVVPKTGTWTVSCTDGESSVSGTVEIEYDGHVVDFKLGYELMLYNLGDYCDDLTGGWVAKGTNDGQYATAKAPSVTANVTSVTLTSSSGDNNNWPQGVYRTSNKIDLSGYTTLYINALISSGTGRRHLCIMDDSKYVAVIGIEQGVTYLDISNYNTESYYVGVAMRPSAGWNSVECKFDKIWLGN